MRAAVARLLVVTPLVACATPAAKPVPASAPARPADSAGEAAPSPSASPAPAPPPVASSATSASSVSSAPSSKPCTSGLVATTLEVRLTESDLPLRGAPGDGLAKAGDVRTFPLCIPPGYRAHRWGAFEPDEGPTFHDRDAASRNLRALRIRVSVARSLRGAAESQRTAREASSGAAPDAVVVTHPWGTQVRSTHGMWHTTWSYARLPGEPPLGSSCQVSFGVTKGDEATVPSLLARGDAICASLRRE